MAQPRRWFKGAAIGGLLAYTGLALASGLDRAAQNHPGLARFVPSPFASHSLRKLAGAAIFAGRSSEALPLAEASVADAPLDPASTALLGTARLAVGNVAGAERAFRVAGQLGWRDRLTQTYWFGRAIEASDWKVAAMRLDALLRQDPSLLAERRLMDPIELSPAGRDALAQRLAARTNWLAEYTSNLGELSRPILLLRGEVLGAVGAQGNVLGCETVAPLVERLAASGAEIEAARIWNQHCPTARAGQVYDGRFVTATLNQYRTRFAWVFFGHSDTDIILEPGDSPGAQQLSIQTSAGRPRIIAQQMIMVRPGDYVLSWRTADDGDKPGTLVKAVIGCERTPVQWQDPKFDPRTDRASLAVTISAHCPTQWLTFAAGGGQGGSTILADVALEPAL